MTAPAPALTHKQVLTVLSGLLLGMFLAALDQTIVSTAIRTIADDLEGQTAQAWVTTSYLIASTITTPLYGKLSDIYGRKPFYLFAISIFIVGSVLCGTAQDVYQLAALLTSTVVPLLLVAEKGREWGWGSPLTVSLLAVSVLSLAAFVPWETRMGDEAILPVRMFRSSAFSITNVVSLLVGAGMFGGLVVVPLYLQIVKGSSPTEAGLQLTPLMVGIILTSGISGKVMARTGRYKRLPICGTALLILSMLLFSTLDAGSPIWHAMGFMVVMGAGLGLSMQTLVISVQNAMPPRDMGVATSSVAFFRSMGGTFGAAVALAILFGSVRGNIADRAVAGGVPARAFDGFNLDDTTTLALIPPAARDAVLEGFSASMSTVFLVVALLLVPAFLLTFFIREIPLRASGGIAAAHQDAEQDADQEAALQAARAETAVL